MSVVSREPPCVGVVFFFSSRRRHTRSLCDWSSDVCSSDLARRRPEDVRVLGHALVAFSRDMVEDLSALRAFLMERMYRHWRVNRTRSQARRMLDRKTVEEGKRVEVGGRRNIKKKKTEKTQS